ncbi:hypothetical protein H4219_005573 [Mycoemilia scoparia]|uniref:Uncharacterized protein n=1 Tax=Mycoemilia scoparia TaxID=417184 RepID=A0A9W8DPT9_9FUNG|nr:hypothetical protein H4219_005573 [Mycoemilia scoparia]
MYRCCLTVLNKPVVIQGRFQFALQSCNIKSIQPAISLKSLISISTIAKETKEFHKNPHYSPHTLQKKPLPYYSTRDAIDKITQLSPQQESKSLLITDQVIVDELENIKKKLAQVNLGRTAIRQLTFLKDMNPKLNDLVGKFSTSQNVRKYNLDIRSIQEMCFSCMNTLLGLNMFPVPLKMRRKFHSKTIALFEELRETASWVEDTLGENPGWIRFHEQEMHLKLTVTNFELAWDVLLEYLKRGVDFSNNKLVERSIQILYMRTYRTQQFGQDERFVMERLLDMMKIRPEALSYYCYSLLTTLLRSYGTLKDIESIELHRDAVFAKSRKSLTDPRRSLSSTVNFLTIDIIIMYRLLGKKEHARSILEKKVRNCFPEAIRSINREDWVMLIELFLDKKSLCNLINFTKLTISPFKILTYAVDKAINYYESVGNYEKLDKYLDLRLRYKCKIISTTPEIVIKRLFETRPLSEAFLVMLKFGFHLHTKIDKSLPILKENIKKMDKDQRIQFFKEIFSAKDISPEYILYHLENVGRYSKDRQLLSDAQNYILVDKPDIINRISAENFISKVVFSKAFLARAFSGKKFIVPRKDICKILVILLRHITAVKRQSGVGEDYRGTFLPGKVMCFGYVIDLYNPNTTNNILKNNSVWYNRLILPLSQKFERVLLRESLRLGAMLDWRSIGSLLYERAIHHRFEEAHRLMVSTLRDIPRTSAIWIKRNYTEESTKCMVYGLALNMYNFMGRNDITGFIMKKVLELHPKFGLITPSAFHGLVSTYIDSISFDKNSTVDDVKNAWNWIMNFGSKIKASRNHQIGIPIDTTLLVLDGHIWASHKRASCGVNLNNCLSYAEALAKKGAPDEALNLVCQGIPKMGLTPDAKIFINMVNYFNNQKNYRYLDILCRHFIKNHPNVVVIAANRSHSNKHVHSVILDCKKKVPLKPSLKRLLK